MIHWKSPRRVNLFINPNSVYWTDLTFYVVLYFLDDEPGIIQREIKLCYKKNHSFIHWNSCYIRFIRGLKIQIQQTGDLPTIFQSLLDLVCYRENTVIILPLMVQVQKHNIRAFVKQTLPPWDLIIYITIFSWSVFLE